MNRNLKKPTSHYLVEINFPFYFNIIGVTETKITKSNEIICTPKISGYNFEHVLTPLAFGGADLFIDGTLNYAVIEKHLKKNVKSVTNRLSCLALNDAAYGLSEEPWFRLMLFSVNTSRNPIQHRPKPNRNSAGAPKKPK